MGLRADFQHGVFEWSWSDWLGLIGLLIAISFVVVVIAAIWVGESPTKLLQQIRQTLALILRRR
jgi:hypothetical protein